MSDESSRELGLDRCRDHLPHAVAAWEAVEDILRARSRLPDRAREIVILTALRRSEPETVRRADVTEAAGVTDELLQAIEAEDWTSEAFSDEERPLFRYALLADAGHGVASKVLNAVHEAYDDGQVVEASMWVALEGARARLAVAHPEPSPDE